jgi:hypothetical protein
MAFHEDMEETYEEVLGQFNFQLARPGGITCISARISLNMNRREKYLERSLYRK